MKKETIINDEEATLSISSEDDSSLSDGSLEKKSPPPPFFSSESLKHLQAFLLLIVFCVISVIFVTAYASRSPTKCGFGKGYGYWSTITYPVGISRAELSLLSSNSVAVEQFKPDNEDVGADEDSVWWDAATAFEWSVMHKSGDDAPRPFIVLNKSPSGQERLESHEQIRDYFGEDSASKGVDFDWCTAYFFSAPPSVAMHVPEGLLIQPVLPSMKMLTGVTDELFKTSTVSRTFRVSYCDPTTVEDVSYSDLEYKGIEKTKKELFFWTAAHGALATSKESTMENFAGITKSWEEYNKAFENTRFINNPGHKIIVSNNGEDFATVEVPAIKSQSCVGVVVSVFTAFAVNPRVCSIQYEPTVTTN